ncbi:uncharacterized protein LOC101239212 [Hydra vulgaris]|uniref:uncharacterized protein LOC101239212 n=1 Tax=Hydra vulgaris TaxID=6087 RepID=UPI001F5E5F9D|nr:uncharacterized protein LOC101239212 [Hydra vulgaris]
MAVCQYTFLCFLYFWHDILEKVNNTQIYLQTIGLSLDKVIIKIEALSLFLNEERQNVVDMALNKALCVSKEHDIPIERRIRLRKKMAGELVCDTKLTIEEENKRTMYEYIDRLNVELQIRSKPLKNILDMFECVQAEFLVSEHNNEEDLTLSIKKLTSLYNEIFHDELILEIPRLKRHLKAAGINLEVVKNWTALDNLTFITEWDRNASNALSHPKIILSICVSVASWERSFSKLKLIKNYLRSTMGQSRLSDLAILYIQCEFVKSIDFDNVIDKFASLKVRKGTF